MATIYPCADNLYAQLDEIDALGPPQSPAQLLDLEARCLAAGWLMADILVARSLERAMKNAELTTSANAASKENGEQPLRGSGSRYVDVRLAGGGAVCDHSLDGIGAFYSSVHWISQPRPLSTLSPEAQHINHWIAPSPPK